MKRVLLLGLILVSYAMGNPPAPLKLVSTSPQFWATNVNASQKTILLTFDQKLRSTLTDWIGLDVLSPPSDLQTKYAADHMSCSIDVHLDPGHVYICALNGRGIPGVGFQTEKGIPLPPTFLVFQTAGNIAPQDAPPHVVRSIPQHGAAVDRTRTQSLTITFDKPMNAKKHGLHMFENNNPVDISKAQSSYSPDGLTFTLPYAFNPSTQYRFELNDVHDIGFSATTRVPLWPVQISFSTGP
jgi:hypothetical protein